MKICEFCGAENPNDAVKCSSCGSNSFKYKCENCGTVFAEGVHCPHCGVKAGQSARTCPVCKTEYYTSACPTCGYIPGSKKTDKDKDAPAQYATGVTPPPGYIPPQTVAQPAKPKRKTWLWVLGWIFIFPLPLTLILAKKKDMNNALKYGIIAAAWIVYLVIAFVGGANNKTSTKKAGSYADQQVTAVQNSTDAPKAEATEVQTEKPTDAPTEDPAAKRESFIASCSSIDYSTLARNPDSHKGENLQFTGQVIQVLDSTSIFSNTTTLRINVTAEENEFADGGYLWSDTIICTVDVPDGADRILEDDIVDIYGTCEGLYTYKTVLGDNKSLPLIDIKYYTIHE